MSHFETPRTRLGLLYREGIMRRVPPESRAWHDCLPVASMGDEQAGSCDDPDH